MNKLTLVSHTLCPYVQRAAIALTEKGVAFDRRFVDLADKPGWFTRVSPLGKVPLLVVDDKAVLFESAVILEYLEETQANPLHPGDPLTRAEHRAWIEFGSAVLNTIARFYSALGEEEFGAESVKLAVLFERLEIALGDGPWFAGDRFSLVDATFGPIFRYFDTFDTIGEFGILAEKPKIAAWRKRLATRPSVAGAVGDDYPAELKRFLVKRNGFLSGLIDRKPAKHQVRPAFAAG